jgi:hypothetical protein
MPKPNKMMCDVCKHYKRSLLRAHGYCRQADPDEARATGRCVYFHSVAKVNGYDIVGEHMEHDEYQEEQL